MVYLVMRMASDRDISRQVSGDDAGEGVLPYA
jgi:hypothetical protein